MDMDNPLLKMDNAVVTPHSASYSDAAHEKLRASGLEVLFDDRDLRAGPKFKDADLIGIPKHIVIGERGLKEGVVELKNRATGETQKLKPEDVITTLIT